MYFKEDIPIWRQIEMMIREKILSEEWAAGQRVPSVRELGGTLAVNPITVGRAYERLQEMGVIENRRGVGSFVTERAHEIVLDEERRLLLEQQAPALVARMKILGIGIEKFNKIYNEYENKQQNSDDIRRAPSRLHIWFSRPQRD